jgi:hypothetical protein
MKYFRNYFSEMFHKFCLINFIVQLSFCYKLDFEFDNNYLNQLNNKYHLPTSFKCSINSFKIIFIKDDSNYISSYRDDELYQTYSSLHVNSNDTNQKANVIKFNSIGILYKYFNKTETQMNFKNEESSHLKNHFKIVLTIFKYYNNQLIETINFKPNRYKNNEIVYSMDRQTLSYNNNSNILKYS